MVRVGGGFMELEEYIKKEAKMECLKIILYMEKHGLTLFETMMKFL